MPSHLRKPLLAALALAWATSALAQSQQPGGMLPLSQQPGWMLPLSQQPGWMLPPGGGGGGGGGCSNSLDFSAACNSQYINVVGL